VEPYSKDEVDCLWFQLVEREWCTVSLYFKLTCINNTNLFIVQCVQNPSQDEVIHREALPNTKYKSPKIESSSLIGYVVFRLESNAGFHLAYLHSTNEDIYQTPP
jgi:hypothetical protein